MSKAWRIRTAGCSLLSAHQLSSALAVCALHAQCSGCGNVGKQHNSTQSRMKWKAGWAERVVSKHLCLFPLDITQISIKKLSSGRTLPVFLSQHAWQREGAWPLESLYSSAKCSVSAQAEGNWREIQHKESAFELGLPFCRCTAGWLQLLGTQGMEDLKGWEHLPLLLAMWGGLTHLIPVWGEYERYWSRNMYGNNSL